MDAYEATKIVFQRIQNLDPQNASKIMGFLLIQDHGEKEMIRLAFSPESLVTSVILKTKKELNLVSPNMPSTPPPSSPFSNLTFSLSRQNSLSSSSSSSRIPSPLSITNNNQSSTASAWTNTKSSSFSEFQTSDDLLISPSPSASYNNNNNNNNNGEVDLIDELQLQDQLSFLNDGPTKSSPLFYQQQQDLASSPTGNDPLLFAAAAAWGGGGASGLSHRRSCSVSDICLGSSDDLISGGGFGWKHCLFYARGYCKNGTTCRFIHGEAAAADGGAVVGSPSKFEMMEKQCQEMLRSKSTQQQQLLASNNFPFSSSPVGVNKCINFLQFPPDSPRGLMMGDGMHKFGRRGDFGINCVNPVSRQIYLTFPADSTFKEEDVSNYFSNFGPVQDVRIPYQQKRMFGFVTFDFPETVKLILAKGNPHFVCDARVLVKPYKEKGKIPDKNRKQQQQMERGDFIGCGSPTGLESRDPYDFQLGARMLYNTTHDVLWRRKLEEQADLEQAIELQNRRLMSLQLLDVKRNSHHRTLSTGAVISSPTFFNQNAVVVLPSNRRSSSPEANEENGSIGTIMANKVHQPTVNAVEKDKDYSTEDDDPKNINGNESPPKESDLHESFEHNLPDSPFASPKAAAAGDYATAFSNDTIEAERGISVPSTNYNNLITGPTLFPANSSLDVASFKSCYFQVPRFASGHETIGT